VIRAEDSRLMGDMQGMRRAYNELGILNGQLAMGYNTRQQSHERLLAALKEVNQMIQKAANLRTGKSKARVISDCRAAVKSNNMASLFRIIRQGYEPNNGLVHVNSASAQAK
jgi:Bardet-Biedl syndrome 2 protein